MLAISPLTSATSPVAAVIQSCAKGYIIRFEKSKQMKNFEIPYYSTNLTPRWFVNSIFDYFFSILIVNLYPEMKTE